jgi:lysophospholipase L1-like esterase
MGAVVMMAATAAMAQGAIAQGPMGLTAARPAGKTVRIELIGDSTQTDQAGYGRGFCANVTAAVDCINMSRGGTSTHTFRELGIWDKAIASKPDYMLIQFGHNDEVTPEHLPRQTPIPQYIENLKRFVTEARAAGVKPILVTPLTRRNFEADGVIHSDLTEYANALAGVSKEMNTPLIDLQADSIALLNGFGEMKSQALGITKKDTDGKTIFDRTHLNWAGSYVFGRMVAVDMGNAAPELAKYVTPMAAVVPPEGVKAYAVIHDLPIKIVLVGDSTVAVGGGWGPGFCAVLTKNVTCVNDARNGRSTKSYIDEGSWKKALDEKGDYYLIQFGHNDQKKDLPALYTDPATSFPANLHRMIADVRAIGGVPIIVTSLSRRTFKDGQVVQDLKEYADAARMAGRQDGVLVVDLNAISTGMLNKMTQEEADKFNAIDHPDARVAVGKSPVDRTHLNPYGQKVFGRIVANTVSNAQVELGPDVIGEPAAAAPAAPAQAAPTDGNAGK